MAPEWRQLLYLPLGLLPSLFFTLRGLLLWLQSEKAKRSYVSPLFWRFSLLGNGLQTLHYMVQIQYPFALIQAISGLLAWRNLDLMQKKRVPKSLSTILWWMGALIVFVTLYFTFLVDGSWLQIPAFSVETTFLWHLVGTLGGLLFASRFWVQWWCAEKAKTSYLGASFFWISLAGSALCLLYFANIRDWISLAQYSAGFVPYIRSLMLIRKNKRIMEEI